jgi:hypothetical protein
MAPGNQNWVVATRKNGKISEVLRIVLLDISYFGSKRTIIY